MPIKRHAFSLFLIISFSVFMTLFVYAQETASEQVDDIQSRINAYEEKLEKLGSQEQTLAREIEEADANISLIQLRISSSLQKLKLKEKEIESLSLDIEDLRLRIIKLETLIKEKQIALDSRIREKYKSVESSPLFVIFGATSFNNLVLKTEYLTILSIQDKKLLKEMSDTKKVFDDQKKQFEEKKVQEEKLRAQIQREKNNLETYQLSLESKKIEKKRLLDVTQNDEKKYQKLLADAKRELNQITGAAIALSTTKGTGVKKGDVIGYQGNTGYSNGDHLHFGVYKYSSFSQINGWDWYYSNYVDPASVLAKKTVYWNTGCDRASSRSTGKGDWQWPISSPTVSQGFGYTCWSSIYYGGKVHPAYDMYGAYGTAVYAVEDGTAYTCRNCLGDGGNGVFIFHGDNYMTLYWHLR